MSIACGLSSVNGSVGGLPLFLRIPKPSPGLLAASPCVKGQPLGQWGALKLSLMQQCLVWKEWLRGSSGMGLLA